MIDIWAQFIQISAKNYIYWFKCLFLNKNLNKARIKLKSIQNQQRVTSN